MIDGQAIGALSAPIPRSRVRRRTSPAGSQSVTSLGSLIGPRWGKLLKRRQGRFDLWRGNESTSIHGHAPSPSAWTA